MQVMEPQILHINRKIHKENVQQSVFLIPTGEGKQERTPWNSQINNSKNKINISVLEQIHAQSKIAKLQDLSKEVMDIYPQWFKSFTPSYNKWLNICDKTNCMIWYEVL